MKTYGNAGAVVVAQGAVDLPTEPAARPAHWPKRPDRTAWTSPIAAPAPVDQQAAAQARATTAAAERAAVQAAAADTRAQHARLRRQQRQDAPARPVPAARPKPGPRKPAAPRQAPSGPVENHAAGRRPGVLDSDEVEQLVDAGLARMTPAVPLATPPAPQPKTPRRGPSARAEIARLYVDEGLDGQQIADRLGMPYGTVYSNLRAAGVQMRPGPKTPPRRTSKVDLDEATRLYAEGWTLTRLADRYGVTHVAVSHRLRKAGVPPRPTSTGAYAHAAAVERRQDAGPAVRALFEEGLTYSQIAVRLDMSQTAVKRVLADLGLKRRQRLDPVEIVRLYVEEGIGIERIARRLQTSQQGVRYQLLKHGVQLRAQNVRPRLADERPDLVERALVMLRAGAPVMVVAATLHVGATTVTRWRDAAGIPARPTGRRRTAEVPPDGVDQADKEPSPPPPPADERHTLLEVLLLERFGPTPFVRPVADPLPVTARRRRVLLEADERRTAEEATA